MKKTAFTFLLSLAWSLGFAQDGELSIDSLKHQLGVAKDDTNRILKMAEICHLYGYTNYDSAMVYGQRALELSDRNNFPRGKARVFFSLGCAYLVHGDISKALGVQLDGLQLAEKNYYETEEASCLMGIGHCYQRLTDNSKAIEIFQRARNINRKVRQTEGLAFIAPETEVNLGITFGKNNQFDSAFVCLRGLADSPPNSTWRAVALTALAEVHIRTGKYQMAMDCLTESLALDMKNEDDYSTMWACLAFSDLYKKMNRSDSSLYYAQKGLRNCKEIGRKRRFAQVKSDAGRAI
ncbi:MAG: tetratricopeptide repeat protein [Lewinellaceae bacterium]|nr:tetratricopeptide repeat protein [Lewinellaceae bacterium]